MLNTNMVSITFMFTNRRRFNNNSEIINNFSRTSCIAQKRYSNYFFPICSELFEQFMNNLSSRSDVYKESHQ